MNDNTVSIERKSSTCTAPSKPTAVRTLVFINPKFGLKVEICVGRLPVLLSFTPSTITQQDQFTPIREPHCLIRLVEEFKHSYRVEVLSSVSCETDSSTVLENLICKNNIFGWTLRKPVPYLQILVFVSLLCAGLFVAVDIL